MAKQAMYKTVITVSDIKRQRLIYYIREKAVIIIQLHSQHHSYTTIVSVDQITNLMISRKTTDQTFINMAKQEI